ncbi:MAG: hypothetical protein CME32_17670 [Gimesia sp.]|nr:hypothetical protein [Gimesia sp.]
MTDQPAIDEQGAIIPRYPIQVWLSRGGLLLTGILFVLLQFLGPGKISVETIGDSTVYRSESYLLYFLPFVALILLTLSVVYWLQKGIFYFFSVCLFLMGVCVLFFFFTFDTKNQHVTVTPDGFVREVGFSLMPIHQEMEFSKISMLYVEELTGENDSPRYELLGIPHSEDAPIRVPINELMKPALLKILANARKAGTEVLPSVNGTPVPDGLVNQVLH